MTIETKVNMTIIGQLDLDFDFDEDPNFDLLSKKITKQIIERLQERDPKVTQILLPIFDINGNSGTQEIDIVL